MFWVFVVFDWLSEDEMVVGQCGWYGVVVGGIDVFKGRWWLPVRSCFAYQGNVLCLVVYGIGSRGRPE
jgi:hypothetical protein